METPAISVLMPVYNAERWLPATLASLSAQTFAAFELIAVDDCSSDGSVALLREWGDPRLTLIEARENGGPVRARNIAAAAARGRYLVGLDADDTCRPERFARQVAYLEAQDDVVCLGTQVEFLVGDAVLPSTYPGFTTPALIEWLLLIANPLAWSSVMIRADAVRGPLMDPSRVYAEDFDLYHRLARAGRIARLDEPLLLYRQHPGGISKRFRTEMLASTVAVLTEAYRPAFGEEAGERAVLIARHVMGREPPPDRATLRQVGETIMALQRHVFATRALEREDRKLIRWETARRWSAIGRSGLRAGTLELGDAMAARIDHLGLGHAGPEELLLDRAIGGAKALRRRFAGS